MLENYFLIFILLILTSCSKNNQFQFKEINSYNEIENDLFYNCDKNTLITFDVDNTLTISRDNLFREIIPWYFKYYNILKHPTLLKKDNFEYFASIAFEQTEYYIFDPNIIEIIKKLKNKGCKVVVLTSMHTGKFGKIEKMEEWRSNILKKLGLNFSSNFENRCFEAKSFFRNHTPCIHDGIIFADLYNKATVLEIFLESFQFKPNKIISFDNHKNVLNSIQKMCTKNRIEFIGYLYLGIEKFYKPWDNKVANFQIDYLIKNSQWISDDKTKELLEKSTN